MRKNRAGFTLIETLVIVFLSGVVLLAGGNLFFGIMRGSSKAEVEREVKQNGNYALAIMERMIRNSRSLEACDPDYLIIENYDRQKTKFHVDSGRFASSSGEPDFSHHLYLISENIEVSSSPSPIFTCYPEDFTSPEEIRRVGISFSLSPKSGSVEAPETFSVIEFQTTVSLRNF